MRPRTSPRAPFSMGLLLVTALLLVAAPAWAQGLVEERFGEPVYLAGPGGELGALLPIRLKSECQMCHGPAESISDEVRAAIAEHYPEDQATGFTAGDLRGWFWVEVPPGATEIGL